MNQPKKIIIGTRGSQLALWQAHFTQKNLQDLGFEVELKIIKTKGDIVTLSFDKIEGKGFFTKEIEEALLANEIDLAVHSYKDLPTESPEGLLLAANSYREDPADWLLINPNAVDKTKELSLKLGARVGTSSPRRKAQLLALRPDLQLVDIRGNVATRLAKAQTELDAVVLAAAGLRRLNLPLDQYHLEKLSPQYSIPAPAQGVLAYQIRSNDTYMQQVAAKLHHQTVADCLWIERTILQQLGGGCQQPIGVYCEQDAQQNYHVWASRSTAWNEFPNRIYIKGTDKVELANQATELLLNPERKTVFISRKLNPDSYMYKALVAKRHIFASGSLVEFSPVPFDNLPITDWVFFSSRNAAYYFFSQNPTLSPNAKIAALGGGTAQAIREMGYAVDFIGHHTDTEAVAQQFLAAANNNNTTTVSVLFPQAAQSLQNVQKSLENKIIAHNVVVYDNKITGNFILPACEIVIFTSPLNVQAYCQKYPLLRTQKLVAIGKTTGKALEKFGYNWYIMPHSTDELGLADVCY